FLSFAVGFLAGLANVNPALEESAVLNGDALSHDVASKRALVANVHAVAGHQVTADFADAHDLARIDVGVYHAITADGHAVAGKVDGPFHTAVNVKRLRAGDLAFDHQRLADGGLVGAVERGVARRGCGRRLSHRSGGSCRARRFRARRSRDRGLIRGLPHRSRIPFVFGGGTLFPHVGGQICIPPAAAQRATRFCFSPEEMPGVSLSFSTLCAWMIREMPTLARCKSCYPGGTSYIQ